MDPFYWIMPVAFSILFGGIFGGIYLIADSKSNELAYDIQTTPLSKTSCEKMYNIKHNLSKIDVMFYNEDKVIKQADIKWEGMNCDDKESSYWRGVNWDWTDSVENKIKEFEK